MVEESGSGNKLQRQNMAPLKLRREKGKGDARGRWHHVPEAESASQVNLSGATGLP